MHCEASFDLDVARVIMISPHVAWKEGMVDRRTRALAGVAAVVAGEWLAGCAVRAGERTQTDIGSCPRRVTNYLAAHAQQCWFNGPEGRWRTLAHELHYDVVVVEVEAATLDAAPGIARRFVELHGERFVEIVVYVQAERAPVPSPIRRMRWTRGGGFETLDFTGTLRRDRPPRRDPI